MNEKSARLISEARELARRVNVQLLLIGGGLFLIWITTFEPKLEAIEVARDSLAQQSVWLLNQKSALEKKEVRSKELRSRLAILAKCNSSSTLDMCKDAPRRSFYIQRQLDKLKDTSESTRKDAASRRDAIANELSSQVSFDVGAGLKLPFSLSYAPLIWLLVLGGILIRIGLVRARFWQLISEARSVSVLSGNPPPTRAAVDAPFWLLPAPRRSMARAIDLEAVVGWRKLSAINLLLLLCATVIALILIARIFWFGVLLTQLSNLPPVNLLTNGEIELLTAGKIKFTSPMTLLLCAASITDLVLIAWLLLPHRRFSLQRSVAPVRETRRMFVVACASSIAIGVGGTLGVTSVFNNSWTSLIDGARIAARRNNRRRVVSSSLSLPPGQWYRNRRSQNYHFIERDGTVKGVVGLKEKNIDPIRAISEAMDRGGYYKIPFEMWEHFILVSLKSGDVIQALEIARQSLESRSASASNIRIFDLVAGLAIFFKSPDLMNNSIASIKYFGVRYPSYMPQIEARLNRWRSPEGQAWREERWGAKYPLKWSGNQIKF